MLHGYCISISPAAFPMEIPPLRRFAGALYVVRYSDIMTPTVSPAYISAPVCASYHLYIFFKCFFNIPRGIMDACMEPIFPFQFSVFCVAYMEFYVESVYREPMSHFQFSVFCAGCRKFDVESLSTGNLCPLSSLPFLRRLEEV